MKDFLRRKFLNSHRRHQTHCQQKSDEQQHHHQSPTNNKRVVLSSDCGGDGDEEEGYYNSTEEDIYVEVRWDLFLYLFWKFSVLLGLFF